MGTMKITIPDMPTWEQIGGDMNPGTYGGTIARSDHGSLELLKIQPVREHVGDKEAAEVGFPFWTREAYFDLSDLDPNDKDVKSALDSIGMNIDTLENDFTPTQRALVIAEALLDYGHADEGQGGWSKDVVPEKVKWWGGKTAGPEYFEDEDEVFRDEVLGWGDIKTALEEEAERLADESAAEAWSTAGDQMESDLEEEGYDPKSIVILAEFGASAAINGDLTDKTVAGLESELESDGYQYVSKAGGRVPSEEAFAYADTIIEATARELKLPAEQVAEVAETLDWWQEEIPRGTSGHTYVWAKKKTGAEERRGTRRR